MSGAGVSDLDPVAERLLEQSRTRETVPLEGNERKVRWFTAGTFLVLAGTLAVVAPPGRPLDPVLLVLLLGSFGLASRVEFEIGSGFAIPTELVFVPMLFLLPPRIVPLIVAAGFVLPQLPMLVRAEAPLRKVVVPLGNAWFALGPALVFVLLGAPSPVLGSLWVLVVALCAQFAVDLGGSIVRERLALGIAPRDLLRPLAWVFVVDACLAPVGLAVAVAASTTSAFAVLVPLPLLALLSVFSRERQQRLGHELELSTAYRGTAFLLGDVVEADDAYTGSHSREVVDLVLGVCDRLGLDPRSRRKAEFAALLHDIGKIRISSEIINKPGPLTTEEREIINTHTIEGESLLTPIGGLLAEVGVIVRSCHEHYDGTGYPDGLAGEEIALTARIVSACDAYNAMVTTRSYRKGRSAAAALAEMEAHRGTQFDPDVVDALVLVIGDTSESYDVSQVPSAEGSQSGGTHLSG